MFCVLCLRREALGVWLSDFHMQNNSPVPTLITDREKILPKPSTDGVIKEKKIQRTQSQNDLRGAGGRSVPRHD